MPSCHCCPLIFPDGALSAGVEPSMIQPGATLTPMTMWIQYGDLILR